jgi:hypothetical protein
VAVAAVLQSTGATPGVAAERCINVPRRTWYLPGGGTGRGETTYLVIMNPFGEDATFTAEIATEKRTKITPSRLTPYVLAARTSVAVRLNDYVLQGAGERIVSTQVVAKIGRVVTGLLTESSEGISGEAGSPAAHTRWIIPGAAYEGPSLLALANPSSSRSDLTVSGRGRRGPLVISGIGGLSLGSEQVLGYEVEAERPIGTVVESTNRIPIVAARRLTGTNGDPATITGADTSYRRWLVLPTLPLSGGHELLVVENPGLKDVRLSVQLIGAAGPVAAGDLASSVVRAGRTLVLDLTTVAGGRPVSALLSAEGGTIVAAGTSYSADGLGYAATLGVPILSIGND